MSEGEIDYTKLCNEIMGIIFAKSFYEILENAYIEMNGGEEHKTELVNRKNLTKINLQNYLTFNCNTKREVLNDYVRSILRTWIPLSREIPTDEYHNLVSELFEYIDDQDKILANQLKSDTLSN
jgi:hypothetical protein